jgi:hypothetical protein
MLMVTEMAGGFHLLVPAGLAVMISYLLQDRLSTRLKYRSLYEGQVPTQRDSPAHYLDHIHTALTLLGKRNLHLTENLGHIDLLRLIRSRVRLDLPGKKELTMALVSQESPLAGKTIGWLYRELHTVEFEIIAVMRREHVLLPHPDSALEANDRLILITSVPAREPLRKFLTPLSQPEEGAAQVAAAEART